MRPMSLTPLALAGLAAAAGWSAPAAAAAIEAGTYAAGGNAAIRLLVQPTQSGDVAFLLHRSTRGGICLMAGAGKPDGDTLTWTSNSGAVINIRFDGRGATIETKSNLPPNCDGAPRIAGAYVFDSRSVEFDRAEIGAVQGALTALGYNIGRADGVLGRRSLAAVQDYQTRSGLQSPDGGLTVETVAHLASGGRPVASAAASASANAAPTPLTPQAQAPTQATNPVEATAQALAAAAPSAPTPPAAPPALQWLDPIPDRLIPLLEARYAPMVSPAVINWRDAPFQVAEVQLDDQRTRPEPNLIIFWNDAKHCDATGCPWEVLSQGTKSLTPIADGKARQLALAPSSTSGKRDLLVDGDRLLRWNGKNWTPDYYKPEKVR